MLNLIKAEYIKYVNSKAILFIMFLPAILIIISSYENFSLDSEAFNFKCRAINDFNPWNFIYRFPLFIQLLFSNIQIGITVHLILNIESKANGWKYILTKPIRKFQYLILKIIIC